eukprot:CAMPEP_0194266392 /NCGR_PEP_ID=MMETSP0169-20130528/1312_1 /TAXON_ID=218684 /ORGANISM="Corethron pennatum, Strain L29A3" /LENGTH=52 /DNA_ID=CAMNT_0039007061 /DNA_START=96 /DNA_END=251 /DNA_ORIENTATION=+
MESTSGSTSSRPLPKLSMSDLLDLSACSGTSAQQPSPSSVPAAPVVPPPTTP